MHDLSHYLIEELHYRLTLVNYENGAEILYQGQECQAITFIVSGEVELNVEKSNGDILRLDTLPACSHIGAYSVLNSSRYRFSVKAKGNI